MPNTANASYNASFYGEQIEGSLRSAGAFVKILRQHLAGSSVIDVGCGRGAWLKAFKDAGAERLVGLDGAWNTQANMIDPNILFKAVDLNRIETTALDGKFDVAVSVEVAEHLEPTSARPFVRLLTAASDVVVFGAAYPRQGGTEHINEQPQTYWARLFTEQGFAPYDLFRAELWGRSDVEYWYQQNTFLYVRNGSPSQLALNAAGLHAMANLEFMNCVHPTLYGSTANQVGWKAAFSRTSAFRNWARIRSRLTGS